MDGRSAHPTWWSDAKPYRLTAGGGDVFRNFVVPVQVNETKYVRAVELRPGDKRLVHHANIWIDRRQSLRRRDGEDGQPGFPGMENSAPRRARIPSIRTRTFCSGSLARWSSREPAGMSWRLDPGTDLILNLHLKPSGKAETIRPCWAVLRFRSPRRFPMLVQLEHDGAIDIAPDARDFEVTDHLTLPVAVDCSPFIRTHTTR